MELGKTAEGDALCAGTQTGEPEMKDKKRR